MTKVKIGVKDIPNVISALEELRDYVDKELPKNISKDITRIGKRYLENQYKTSPNRIDPNIDFDSISVSIKETENGYKLIAKGKDLLYEEFGTGDEGSEHPHPEKSKYPLNAYNSGPYIRDVSSIDKDSYTGEDLKEIGITSGKFWYYQKGGIGYYTQGIPAGKEFWNTRNILKSKKVQESILRQWSSDINDKFIKAIKK